MAPGSDLGVLWVLLDCRDCDPARAPAYLLRELHSLRVPAACVQEAGFENTPECSRFLRLCSLVSGHHEPGIGVGIYAGSVQIEPGMEVIRSFT
ncbi:hypothetical protein D3C81_1962490 [compost metagenome]